MGGHSSSPPSSEGRHGRRRGASRFVTPRRVSADRHSPLLDRRQGCHGTRLRTELTNGTSCRWLTEAPCYVTGRRRHGSMQIQRRSVSRDTTANGSRDTTANGIRDNAANGAGIIHGSRDNTANGRRDNTANGSLHSVF